MDVGQTSSGYVTMYTIHFVVGTVLLTYLMTRALSQLPPATSIALNTSLHNRTPRPALNSWQITYIKRVNCVYPFEMSESVNEKRTVISYRDAG